MIVVPRQCRGNPPGDALNSHVHFHVLVTDGVFIRDAADPDATIFHPATHLDAAAASEMRTWQHGGGWSVHAAVQIADWDRQGIECLVRYCARPALAAGRLGRLNADTLVYRMG